MVGVYSCCCCYCLKAGPDPSTATWSLEVSGLHDTGPGSICFGQANGSWTLAFFQKLSPAGLCPTWEWRTSGFASGIGWRLLLVDRWASTASVLEARHLASTLIWQWRWNIGNCTLVPVSGCPATGNETFTLVRNDA